MFYRLSCFKLYLMIDELIVLFFKTWQFCAMDSDSETPQKQLQDWEVVIRSPQQFSLLYTTFFSFFLTWCFLQKIINGLSKLQSITHVYFIFLSFAGFALPVLILFYFIFLFFFFFFFFSFVATFIANNHLKSHRFNKDRVLFNFDDIWQLINYLSCRSCKPKFLRNGWTRNSCRATFPQSTMFNLISPRITTYTISCTHWRSEMPL